MTVMLTAASALAWVTKLLKAENETALLAPLEAGEKVSAQSPIFLPYLSGERTPHNDVHAAACCSASMPRTARPKLPQRARRRRLRHGARPRGVA